MDILEINYDDKVPFIFKPKLNYLIDVFLEEYSDELATLDELQQKVFEEEYILCDCELYNMVFRFYKGEKRSWREDKRSMMSVSCNGDYCGDVFFDGI